MTEEKDTYKKTIADFWWNLAIHKEYRREQRIARERADQQIDEEKKLFDSVMDATKQKYLTLFIEVLQGIDFATILDQSSKGEKTFNIQVASFSKNIEPDMSATSETIKYLDQTYQSSIVLTNVKKYFSQSLIRCKFVTDELNTKKTDPALSFAWKCVKSDKEFGHIYEIRLKGVMDD